MRKWLMYEETRLWALLDDPRLQPLEAPERLLSARALAERVGVHESYLSRLRAQGKRLAKERGEPVAPGAEWEPVRVQSYLAERVAAAFGLAVEEVFRKPQWYAWGAGGLYPTDPPGPEDEVVADEPEGQVGTVLTLAQAARRLGVANASLRQSILRGRLRAEKFGHQWVVTPEALEEYAQSRRTWRTPLAEEASPADR